MKKFAKKALAGALSLAMVLSFGVTSNPESAAAKKVTVKKVTVSSPSGKTAYVAKGKKVKLTATVKVSPNKSANKKVTYKSANSKVASVNSKGQVKGVKAGKTKITVTSKKDSKKKATISVVVKSAAIKKVTISAKKATIAVGATKKLTAKATPKKNTSTKIAWSSSKKKVATVSSAGVVKGVKAGTATITAAAADGSGKKATCKVTVTNAVNMKAMDVLNAQSVTFALDKAQALTPDKVNVKTKEYADGTYNKDLKIDSMTTTDNVNYNVVFNSSNRIWVNEYVQISVPSLTGSVKSMEKKYSQDLAAFTNEQISEWTVGTWGKDSFSFGQADGYSSYEITGLPAGLSSEVKENRIYVKGEPTAAGTTAATMTAKDELGNTLTKTIYFIVGSETQIAGAACPVYRLASDVEFDANASFTGGSGHYNYSIVADTGAAAILNNSEGYGSPSITAKIAAPGDYNVTVRATDSKNPALTADAVITIHVAQGVTIAGMIKDATGNAISSTGVWGHRQICFTNKNRAERYGSSLTTYASIEENGTYSALVPAGTYDIQASYYNASYDDEDDYSYELSENAEAVNYLYKQSLTTSQSGFDISLPLYKVTLVSSDENIEPKYQNWYADHEYIGHGDTLYVKAGNYALETSERTETGEKTGDYTWFNGGTVTYSKNIYKYTATANVATTAVQTAVTKTPVRSENAAAYKYSAAKDTTYEVTELDEYYDLDETDAPADCENDYYGAYKFTVTEAGSYYLTNSDVYFYNMSGTRLTPDEDGNYALTAGTYIIGDGNYYSYEGFRVEKVTTTSTDDE